MDKDTAKLAGQAAVDLDTWESFKSVVAEATSGNWTVSGFTCRDDKGVEVNLLAAPLDEAATKELLSVFSSLYQQRLDALNAYLASL